MPQRLTYFRKVTTIQFGPDLVDRIDPVLLGTAAKIISRYAYLEHSLVRLAAHFLGANAGAVGAMLGDLHNSSLVLTLVSRAAPHALDSEAIGYFDQTIPLVQAVRRVRNHLAHGVWATSPQLPDALLIIESQHLVEVGAAEADWLYRARQALEGIEIDHDHPVVSKAAAISSIQRKSSAVNFQNVLVYRKVQELDRCLRECDRIDIIIRALEWMVSPYPLDDAAIVGGVVRQVLQKVLLPHE